MNLESKDVLFVTVFGAIIWAYMIFKRDSRISKYLSKFNGPIDLPFFGSTLWLLRPKHELAPLITDWGRKYGSIFKVWFVNIPFVAVCEASSVEKILSSTVHIEKSKDYDLLHNWLGLGLLTAKRTKWHSRRKQLTPAFHFKILEEFNPVFNEQANIFISVLKKKCADGKPFNIFPYVTRCALDIICETAMGRQLNAQLEQDIPYVKAVYTYGDAMVSKFIRPWLRINLIWELTGNAKIEAEHIKILHGFTEKVIAEKKLERKKNKATESLKQTNDEDQFFNKKRKAFLDLLLDMSETDNSLTDKEIREETDTFMFEGHDTTAANMAWTILAVSSHPEVLKKVQEELDEIFGSDKEKEITIADVAKMKYLECCVKEALRLFPSVPYFFRNLSEDADMGAGKIIPKGTSVCICAYGLHRDPKVFPQPEEFVPERFLPENSIGRNPFAYIPFSAGPRNCIGQKFALLEEKIVLAKLFQNFNIQSMKKMSDVAMIPDIIGRPMDGVEVKITQRI